MNKLDSAFTNWLATANYFCSSLVDRIVPGKLSATDQVDTEKRLGYSDKLMIMAECFCLWAIESDNKYVKEILSFAKIDDGLVISPDIEIFRELKLRLLNGTHSFSCGLAFLAGFKTVKDAMNDPHFISYVQDLAQNEIAEAISSPGIVYADAFNFAKKIIDRFRNPFIDHLWINIAVQYSEKMKQRNIPVLVRHYGKYSHVPEHMALGFAGFLLFMKCHRNAKGDFVGEINGTQYPVQDDYAEYFARKWNQAEADEAIDKILGDKEFWGTDLSLFNGFVEAVKKHFYLLTRNGVIAAISQTELNKTVA
jgi:tagaturonate reductase